MKNKILIEDTTLITMNENLCVLPRSSLLIEGEKIKSIQPREALSDLVNDPDVYVINGKGKVVVPGFINAHTHFYSSLVRGFNRIKPSLSFVEVLENLWWKVDKNLTMEACEVSAAIACVESIKSGTTTLFDHHASPGCVKGVLNQLADVVKKSGLRASLCYELSDRDGKSVSDQGIEENLSFFQDSQRNSSALLRSMFGLHASFTLTEETLKKVQSLCQNLNIGFHIHCAEAQFDQEDCIKNYGMRVVERLYHFDLLSSQSILAHGVFLDQSEIDLIKKTGATLIHNPQSNMNNAVGVCPVLDYFNQDLKLALGTDSMTVNMLEELRVAIWQQKVRAQNPSVAFLELCQILFEGNVNLACHHWNQKLGKLKTDFQADLVLIDYDPPTELSDQTVWGHFVFGLYNQPVATTIVNGKILMEDRKLVCFDEESIYAEARKQAQYLWSKINSNLRQMQ